MNFSAVKTKHSSVDSKSSSLRVKETDTLSYKQTLGKLESGMIHNKILFTVANTTNEAMVSLTFTFYYIADNSSKSQSLVWEVAQPAPSIIS